MRRFKDGMSLRQMQKDLDDATKQAQDAMNGFENLAEYLRRDCLEISDIPSRESYTCNQLVMAVGYAACTVWDKIPLTLKELNTYQFQKHLKPYMLSEQHS